jgi:hypothetical protein
VLNLGLILGLSAIAVVGSFAWLFLLSRYAMVVLNVTGLVLPLTFLFISVNGFITFLQIPPNDFEFGEYKLMALFSFMGMVGAIFSGIMIWRRRWMIKTLEVVIKLASNVLKANPTLFLLSFSLTAVHFLFSLLWLWLFSHIFLHGELVSIGDIVRLVLLGSTKVTAIFFIIMYFWTSSLLQNIEKTTVASVVGEWYFEAYDSPITTDETIEHFKYVSSRSFGPIAFASLILGAVRMIQFLVNNFEV